MADAIQWIKSMLAELRERLNAERDNLAAVPPEVVEILALFDKIQPDSPEARGLARLIVEIMREVHSATFEQALATAAEVAAEIFEEGQR